LDSSVGIATDWTAGVRFPVGARDFPILHSVETGSGAHSASHPVVIVGSFCTRQRSGRSTMLQARRSRDRVSMRWMFSNLPNPSGRTMALVSTQPLTEMSTRNLKKRNQGAKCGRRVGLTTLPHLLVVCLMWEPRPLATPGASTACDRDIFTLPLPFHWRKATGA
jgi:hypothetical protein